MSGYLGIALRLRRMALGLSVNQLSRLLGVDAHAIRKWERGEVAVGHPATRRRILSFLEDGGWLATLPPSIPPPLQKVVGRLRELLGLWSEDARALQRILRAVAITTLMCRHRLFHLLEPVGLQGLATMDGE